MIRDLNLARHRVIKRIPYQLFGWLPHTSSVTDDAVAGADNGAPQILELTTFGVAGGAVAAAADTFSCFDLDTLSQIDYSQQVGVRVVWSDDVASPSAGDVAGWVVKYKKVILGSTVIAAGGTALNTTIGAQTPATTVGQLLRRTARGAISANTFAATDATGGLVWLVKCSTLTNYSANEVKLLALEIDFFPKYLRVSGQTTTYLTTATAS